MANEEQGQQDSSHGGGLVKSLAKATGRRVIGGSSAAPFIALGLIAFFTAIVLLGGLAGGVQGTNAGEPNASQEPTDEQPNASPPGTDTTPGPISSQPPDCSSIDARLKSDFGVLISEMGESVSCDIRQQVYKIYSVPTRSQAYLQALHPETPFKIEFKKDNPSCNCSHGYTPTGSAIEVWDLANFLSKESNFRSASIFLIHETGHLIKHRGVSKFGDNYPNSYLSGQDSGCYDQGFLKTYSLRTTNPVSESMAEASALYVYNSKKGKYASIDNFRNECPATWKWMNENLFGGTIF